MAETELLVGTRKGLFVLRGERGGPLEIAARCFEKEPVEYACFDQRSGTYLASVTHWPEEVATYFPGSKFGPRIYLTGEVADVTNLPSGCHFHPRCRYAVERCRTEIPALRDLKSPDGASHLVACHRAEELSLQGVAE